LPPLSDNMTSEGWILQC